MVIGFGVVEAAHHALDAAPAHVLPLANQLDGFVAVLLHVAAIQFDRAAAHVERAAPRVAYTISPDFRVGVAAANEGVVARDAVGFAVAAGVDVDTQDLAQVGAQILPVASCHVVADAPVVGVTTVAQRNVQLAVRAKTDPVAVVVELRPRVRHDAPRRTRVGGVLVLGRDRVFLDHIAVVVQQHLPQVGLEVERRAVGDVELAVFLELRVEGDAQQSAFVEVVKQRLEFGADVEEGAGLELAVFQDLDAAVLFDDEHPVVARRLHHRKRRVHRAHHLLKFDLRLRQRRSAGQGQTCHCRKGRK